jgi:hypothetical protein
MSGFHAQLRQSISLGHRLKLQDTAILSTKATYMDQMTGEATEIELHPNNMKREGGRHLNHA